MDSVTCYNSKKFRQ